MKTRHHHTHRIIEFGGEPFHHPLTPNEHPPATFLDGSRWHEVTVDETTRQRLELQSERIGVSYETLEQLQIAVHHADQSAQKLREMKHKPKVKKSRR